MDPAAFNLRSRRDLRQPRIRTPPPPPSRGKEGEAYLLEFAVARAHEGHRVAAVVVRRHRGHAVVFVDEERDALDGAGAPQRLVEVLTAEVVVDLQRLEGGADEG